MSKKKKGKHSAHKTTVLPTMKGVLEVTRSGIGYVVMSEGVGDILVRPGDFNTALHGDTVRVKVIKENANTKKKEGRITEVVQRKQTEFIGHIQLSTNFAFFIPTSEKPMPDIFIPLFKLKGAKNKEKVIVKLVQWEKAIRNPLVKW